MPNRNPVSKSYPLTVSLLIIAILTYGYARDIEKRLTTLYRNQKLADFVQRVRGKLAQDYLRKPSLVMIA
jgi:hypothetical protein